MKKMNGFSALLTIFDNGMKKRTQIQWILYWESRKKENDNNNNKEMKKSRASIKELRILESHMCANLTHLHAPANSIRFYSKSCFVPIFKRFFPLKANVQRTKVSERREVDTCDECVKKSIWQSAYLCNSLDLQQKQKEESIGIWYW